MALWHGETSTAEQFHDGMFLGAIIGLSCILYLPGLGWYSDDWAFLARLTDSLVLVTIVLLLHRLLVNLRAPREIALSVALVLGLLPHYSTDRFWIAAFQANPLGGILGNGGAVESN